MPVLCRPTSLQNPCIKRLKNLSDSFESSSDGPLRDGETFHRQCFSDPVQRPLKEELFQDKLSPEPGGEFTFEDKLGDDRRRYNSGGIFAIAGRSITPPLINVANQANFPINLLGIFSVSKLFIRLAAFFATLFVFRQVAVNLLGWKFGVKFSSIAFSSGLFAPIALLPLRPGIFRTFLVSSARIAVRFFTFFGLPSEQLLLQPNKPGLQSLNLLVFFNKLNCLLGYVLLRFQSSLLPGLFPFNRTRMLGLSKIGFLAKVNNCIMSFRAFCNHAPVIYNWGRCVQY